MNNACLFQRHTLLWTDDGSSPSLRERVGVREIRIPYLRSAGALLVLAASVTSFASSPYAASPSEVLSFPLIERFESFGTKDGFPTHKVHCVLPTTDGKLWVGTWNGLVVREDGKFRKIGTEDGLSHKMVVCMVEDPRNGDLWIGTMRGLNRYSGGRVTVYSQTSCGLPNNVIYGVEILGDTLWVATAAGLGAMDLKTGAWKIYDHNNTVMHEPWVYGIAAAKDRVFVAVWGGGILEYELSKAIFKEHRDPDRDFHYDLFPNDGPISDVTSWVAWADGILWQGTYFGMSRYDGLRWRTWQEKKSPLLSNFINFIYAHHRVAWVGTDRGVSVTDGDTWVNYRSGETRECLIEITRPGRPLETRVLPTRLPNDFVLGLWVNDREAWFATSDGLGHGFFPVTTKALTTASATNPATESKP
jgi:ligand-binding sensor domain-containing protein